MRRMAAAIGITVAAGLAPGAQAASSTVWQGTSFVTSATGACAGTVAAGDYYLSVYRPIIAGTQTGPEGLSFIGARSGQLWTTLTATTSFGAGNAVANVAEYSSHATSASAPSGGTYALTVLPTVITAATPTVTITGLLQNFWEISGCNVTISAALTLRP